ncbi:MAG: DNA polymerase III subunit alpha, partial [Oscillospiraceae bacterium]|nr:DNA polymerase III subunit alpha [Oscillospiraceae bacterium]
KSIPNVLNITLRQALASSKPFQELYASDERVKKVVDTAMALEDMPKDSGTHAAGVVITRDPVSDYVPLCLSKKDGSIATQYVMTTLEELGLLKMDFLGLRNLTIIDDAVRKIRRTNPEFDLKTIPEDDKAVFDMLASGGTSGVFQLESTGMTAVCTALKPKSIEDITALIALYRPGPMDSIPRFLEASADPKKVKYKHPMLEPILDVTYGCIVYQEQVIEIFRRLAGFSLGQADMIRRAMSKKKEKEIVKERRAFVFGDAERNIDGAVKHGVPEDVANSIYDEILDFASYAFNKAHAVSYAIVAYQTAYLKAHFPREYMAALMSSVLDSAEKVAEYTAVCKDMGINILPPDINESFADFSVSGGNIRYGLVAIKNIGRGFINALVAERERSGRFTAFDEFCERMYGGELNRRALESMIKCGCFDSLGYKRSQLMEVCGVVMDGVADAKRNNVEGQMDMFGGFGGEESAVRAEMRLPDIDEYSVREKIMMEKEVTGLYLSGHPMDEYAAAVKRIGAVPIGMLLRDYEGDEPGATYRDGQNMTVAGIVAAVKQKTTKNNSLMGYVTIEDSSGSMELIAFQRALDIGGGHLAAGNAVVITGRLSVRDDKPQIVVDTIRPIGDADVPDAPETPPSAPADRKLYVKLPCESCGQYERIKLILTMFPGSEQMILYFDDTKKRVGTKCVIHSALVKELRDMLGDENVVVK